MATVDQNPACTYYVVYKKNLSCTYVHYTCAFGLINTVELSEFHCNEAASDSLYYRSHAFFLLFILDGLLGMAMLGGAAAVGGVLAIGGMALVSLGIAKAAKK